MMDVELQRRRNAIEAVDTRQLVMVLMREEVARSLAARMILSGHYDPPQSDSRPGKEDPSGNTG
jgi:hypothetical protein